MSFHDAVLFCSMGVLNLVFAVTILTLRRPGDQPAPAKGLLSSLHRKHAKIAAS
jgi:hypothetical protein